MLAPRIKAKKCKLRICRIEYLPVRKFQKGCCIDHEVMLGLEAVEKKKRLEEKRERQAVKERLIELKPLQYWLKRAEKAVNAYILERDREQPCISCATWDASEFHAGHFIPVGRSSFLRYSEENIAKQCSQCNVHKGGNATAYEIRLVARIGSEAVERLKASPRSKDWSRDELRAIESRYRAELRRMRDAQTNIETD